MGKTNIGKGLILLFVIMMASGCNGGGMASGPGSAPGDGTVMDQTFMTQSSDLGTDDSSGGDEGSTGTDTIARVHNPEPASMVLFGLGALALLKRKKIAAKS